MTYAEFVAWGSGMRRFVVLWSGLAVACGLLTAASAPAQAQDPSFLTFSGGWFDFNRQKNQAAEFGVQYRSDAKLWIFQPMIGGMITTDTSGYVYAGISLDVFFGNRIVFRPSFAPGLYAKGNGLDLGHVVEFRSAVELAYRFDDRSRLGVEAYHISNAHLGDKNPGSEVVLLTYAIPLGGRSSASVPPDPMPAPARTRDMPPPRSGSTRQ